MNLGQRVPESARVAGVDLQLEIRRGVERDGHCNGARSDRLHCHRWDEGRLVDLDSRDDAGGTLVLVEAVPGHVDDDVGAALLRSQPRHAVEKAFVVGRLRGAVRDDLVQPVTGQEVRRDLVRAGPVAEGVVVVLKLGIAEGADDEDALALERAGRHVRARPGEGEREQGRVKRHHDGARRSAGHAGEDPVTLGPVGPPTGEKRRRPAVHRWIPTRARLLDHPAGHVVDQQVAARVRELRVRDLVEPEEPGRVTESCARPANLLPQLSLHGIDGDDSAPGLERLRQAEEDHVLLARLGVKRSHGDRVRLLPRQGRGAGRKRRADQDDERRREEDPVHAPSRPQMPDHNPSPRGNEGATLLPICPPPTGRRW